MIEVQHLTKKYGDHVAVDDLSFKVEEGQVYGFLGPNGAGKTTTINIITGCLAATSGKVTIDGFDIFEQPIAAKSCIGYLPELPPVYPDMTPHEYLTFVGKMKGIGKYELREKLSEVIEMTAIEDVKDRLIKNLSKGYRQRVGIAQALLGDPKVIILDEPTVGLDPKQIIEIRELIKRLSVDKTVILSSHILSEVSAICDMVLIISQGRLVALDTPEKLTESYAGATVVEVTVKTENMEKACFALRELEKAESVLPLEPKDDGTTTVQVTGVDSSDIREEVSICLMTALCPVLSMDIKRASLEDIFLEVTASEDETYDSDEAEDADSDETGEEIADDEDEAGDKDEAGGGNDNNSRKEGEEE